MKMTKSLDDECHLLLNNHDHKKKTIINTKTLFQSCCFYFVGFEEEEWMFTNPTNKNYYHNDLPYSTNSISVSNIMNPNNNNNNRMILSQESLTESVIFKTKNNNNATTNSSVSNNSSGSNKKLETRHVKQMVSKLIRQQMGTIFWNVHESLTHVIVADNIDTKLR